MSPLLLIYMWLEIKCDLWKGQFHPASSPSLMSAHHSLSIWSYPLWMCRLGLCQSTTSCTELCASLSISKALPHTPDSTDCTTIILPLASAPPHVLLLVCLFVCLPLSLVHVLPSLFVYFPFLLFPLLTGSRPMLSPTAPIV